MKCPTCGTTYGTVEVVEDGVSLLMSDQPKCDCSSDTQIVKSEGAEANTYWMVNSNGDVLSRVVAKTDEEAERKFRANTRG